MHINHLDRLVIEAGTASGWVSDLAESLKLKAQVANGNDERWRWKVVKSKTDRSDALRERPPTASAPAASP
ncbi:MAG: hypothetical protein M0Z50_03390 [Planctomycetia bacterium]|nr:hypothetical protein [Planctomycetia bacterium]